MHTTPRPERLWSIFQPGLQPHYAYGTEEQAHRLASQWTDGRSERPYEAGDLNAQSFQISAVTDESTLHRFSLGKPPAGLSVLDLSDYLGEPAPEDYVISSDGYRLSVGIVEGAHIGTYVDEELAEEAVRVHRERTSPDFYPEVWRVSDHGNVSRYAEGGFDWTPPLLDWGAVVEEAARTAFILTWADAESSAGRSLSGACLEDIAPERTPGRFLAWARDVVSGALDAASDDTREAWARADAEDLGRALALSCGGWTDGFGEKELPRPEKLPILDCDSRLWVEASDYSSDPPSVEDLLGIAPLAAALAAQTTRDRAERIRAAIEEEEPEEALEIADKLLGGYGIDYLDLPAPDEHSDKGRASYVNLGETYTTTLVYVRDADCPDGRFLVASWGNLLEAAEEERTYSTGDVRCPYCSDWTSEGSLESEAGCDSCGCQEI